MFETRRLFTDSFMRNKQYWSVGYYSEADPTMQHDGTWVEIDALPGDSAWSEVEQYLRLLNAPVWPTAEEREASMQTVTIGQAPEAGLLVWSAGDTGRFFVSAEIGNLRSFLSAPYRTEEEAMAELRRVAPMYPGLAWFKVTR